ncbi:MAG: hypothetical protein Q7R35_07835 [Elusimicrobiota bacterium]|nr:hypothetical protein [Elusimicrobiota bacterium]
MRPKATKLCLAAAWLTMCACLPWQPACAAPAEYEQTAGLIDVRSTFSDGAYEIETLAKMAADRGFGILFLNDHDRLVMEYGLPPARNILRKREERNSINKRGAGAYLDAIRGAQRKFPGLILVPGSESAPFYYWTGSYFKKNLTAHEHEKRLLTVGLDKPEDYEGLPLLHNSASVALPAALLLLCALGASIMQARRGGAFRTTGLLTFTLGLGAVFIADRDPFRPSPFDQYHGDRGIAPYQLLVDYVASRGGLTFWNYPETQSGVSQLGPIRLDTPPYPEALAESSGYTGFSALYGDNITATEPGKVWDRVLAAYCRGSRSRPAWGIATSDYHDENGDALGNFRTVFLLREKSRAGVLEAMKGGKMYAYAGPYSDPVKLDEFSIGSAGGDGEGVSGDEVSLKGPPRIRIALSAAPGAGGPVTVRLIRSGKLIKTFEGPLPLKIDYLDKTYSPGLKTYYRLDMRGRGTLVSNPIFVSTER